MHIRDVKIATQAISMKKNHDWGRVKFSSFVFRVFIVNINYKSDINWPRQLHEFDCYSLISCKFICWGPRHSVFFYLIGPVWYMLPFSPSHFLLRFIYSFFSCFELQRKGLKEISSCLQKRPKTLVWLTEFYHTLHPRNKPCPLMTQRVVRSLNDSKQGTVNSWTRLLLKNHINHQIAI